MPSQPGHKYESTGQARVDIPNLLERQFSVAQPNQVRCGDITYVWAANLALFGCGNEFAYTS